MVTARLTVGVKSVLGLANVPHDHAGKDGPMDRYLASNRTSLETALIRRIVLVLAALTLLAVSVSPAMAQGNIVVPPQNTYNGQTYAGWSAQWFQWVNSL